MAVSIITFRLLINERDYGNDSGRYDLEEREENLPIRKGITTDSENFFRTLVREESHLLHKMARLWL